MYAFDQSHHVGIAIALHVSSYLVCAVLQIMIEENIVIFSHLVIWSISTLLSVIGIHEWSVERIGVNDLG